jgi:hypothetical protein
MYILCNFADFFYRIRAICATAAIILLKTAKNRNLSHKKPCPACKKAGVFHAGMPPSKVAVF